MSVEAAFTAQTPLLKVVPSGKEPILGGTIREKAVWVDERDCIGCRYCAHVASNTFTMVNHTGRCRAIRQDGDSIERIQEAIDTCPVDCIHWVEFSKLDELSHQQLEECKNRGIPQ